MKYRKLGTQGLEVSAVGLGCMGMSIGYGENDDERSIDAIHAALDVGMNLLNSSDAYANGKNEELIARAIKGRRDDVIITTKFGQIRKPEGVEFNGRPEYVQQACEASLKRLGVDYIDLYHQHRVDQDTPIEETVGAMAKLVEQGKVKYIGLSEAGPDTIRRANAVHPITALETEYSLWTRDVEEKILPTCRELGVGFVAYAPLGRGFLTGTIRSTADLIDEDARRRHPRFSEENIDVNIALLETIEDVARAHHAKPAQIALAWLLAQGEDIVPIAGTQRRAYVEENAAAVDIELTDDDLVHLDSAFTPGVAAGTRYPAGHLAHLGV
jgi:aryl-alcohol dehydrogenase-like predicted oxidoreductase